jgi:serine phosphatase RsbU (regulator of sigma subunit)
VEAIVKELVNNVESFTKGKEQSDDITVLALKFIGSETV